MQGPGTDSESATYYFIASRDFGLKIEEDMADDVAANTSSSPDDCHSACAADFPANSVINVTPPDTDGECPLYNIDDDEGYELLRTNQPDDDDFAFLSLERTQKQAKTGKQLLSDFVDLRKQPAAFNHAEFNDIDDVTWEDGLTIAGDAEDRIRKTLKLFFEEPDVKACVQQERFPDPFYENPALYSETLFPPATCESGNLPQTDLGAWLVKKVVLKRGRSGLPINPRSVVILRYAVYALDSTALDAGRYEDALITPAFDSTRNHRQLWRENLSRPRVVPGLQAGLRSMVIGEHALFAVKPRAGWDRLGCLPRVPAESACVFDVILTGCLAPGSPAALRTLDDDDLRRYGGKQLLERIEACLERAKLRIQNAVDVKQTQMNSLTYYSDCAHLLHRISVPGEDEDARRMHLLAKTHGNLAVLAWKLKRYAYCMENTRLVLERDPQNCKALLLRAQAAVELENEHEARRCCARLRALCDQTVGDAVSGAGVTAVDLKHVENVVAKVEARLMRLKKQQNELTSFDKEFRNQFQRYMDGKKT